MGLSCVLGEVDLASLPEEEREERDRLAPVRSNYFQVSPKLCSCPVPQEQTPGAGVQ